MVFLLEERTPLIACRILSDLVIATYFTLIYLVAMISLERYCYFCLPFHYQRIITCRRILLVITLVVCAVFVWVVVPEILIGRTMLYANLYCQLENVVIATTYMAFCFAPSFMAVLFSCGNIMHLIRQKARRMANDAIPGFMSQQQILSINRPARSALRIIVMLSGLLLITHIPTTIIRRSVIYSGITWEEIDSRKAFYEAIAIRVCAYVKAVVSPAISPCILLYVNRWLRIRCQSFLRSLSSCLVK